MGLMTRRAIVPLIAILMFCLAGVPGAPAPVRAAGTNTALAIDSEPGDYVGQGQQLEYAPPGSTFALYTGGPGGLAVQVFGPEGGDLWIINIASASSDTLHVGVYENTQRFADASHPGLDVGGQGRGCNMSTGRFEIDEIELDAGGNVTTLDLAFEQHCEGNDPAVFGELRYNAAAGYALATREPRIARLRFHIDPRLEPDATGHRDLGRDLACHHRRDRRERGARRRLSDRERDLPGGCPRPNTSCQIAVRASPLALGARVATLDIALGTIRGQRSIPLAVTGITPVAEIAWGTTRNGGRNYTWNIGQSMARTASSTSAYLHTTMTTDRVGGSWVDDNGPYAGVYYSRTRNAGETWTTPKRLNPSSRHGSRGSIAASGKYVYATWVSTTRWIAYKGSSPRILYLRRNSNHGSSTAWGSTIRLTSTTGRVDWPTVAAAGANVYVAYTNSATGEIKIKISRDRASTWSTKTLGTTSLSSTSGRSRAAAHRRERQHDRGVMAGQCRWGRAGAGVARCRPDLEHGLDARGQFDRPAGGRGSGDEGGGRVDCRDRCRRPDVDRRHVVEHEDGRCAEREDLHRQLRPRGRAVRDHRHRGRVVRLRHVVHVIRDVDQGGHGVERIQRGWHVVV